MAINVGCGVVVVGRVLGEQDAQLSLWHLRSMSKARTT